MIRRPYSSEIGAEITGPMVKPKVKSERGRSAIWRVTSNSAIMNGIAGTYTDVPTVLSPSQCQLQASEN